jgi:predicted acylesterase/phospholipase RssA
VARAVVSSAAFPGGFAPLVLDARALFPAHPRAPREVLLSDGGVDDNLGVQALLKEECTALVVSDGSYPFENDERPLDRFGLPLPRRLLVGVLLAGLAAWGAARLDLPAAMLATLGALAVAILLRLRLALFLLGSVMMRGQRRGLLRRLFAAKASVPTIYLGLSTALSADSERRLREKGIDVARLRRVRTDLDLSRRDVDGLVALGEALAGERLR